MLEIQFFTNDEQKINNNIDLLKTEDVETLIINNIPLVDKHFIKLCEALKAQTKLLNLEVNVALEDRHIISLSKALKTNQSIKTFKSNLNSKTLAVSILLQTLNTLPNIEEIALIGGDFLENHYLLQANITPSKSIKKLTFRNCIFQSMSGSLITSSLYSNKLETLEFRDNALGHHFVKHITLTLKDHQNLTTLKFESCLDSQPLYEQHEALHLGNSGAKHIAEFLLYNNNIQHLSISGNQEISLSGCLYISNALKYNTSLNLLEIEKLKLRYETRKVFIEDLYNNLMENKNLLTIVNDFMGNEPCYKPLMKLLINNNSHALDLAICVDRQTPLDRKSFLSYSQENLQ